MWVQFLSSQSRLLKLAPLHGARPAPHSFCQLRCAELGVGDRAGEVVPYDLIYCGCGLADGGCSGELGGMAMGLGTSCMVGASEAGG